MLHEYPTVEIGNLLGDVAGEDVYKRQDVHFEPPLTEYWYDVIAAPPLDDGARTTRSKPPTNADSLSIVARPGTFDVVSGLDVT